MEYKPERALIHLQLLGRYQVTYPSSRNGVQAREGIDTGSILFITRSLSVVEMEYQPERALIRFFFWKLYKIRER